MRARLFASAITMGLLLSSGEADATIIVPMSVEEMAAKSVSVVRARVVGAEARWDKAKRGIHTYTTLEVLEAIHGPQRVGDRMTVRTLGGEVGEVGMRVAGTPKFASREEVVVMVRRDPMNDAHFQCIGMSQGKYRVERTAIGQVVVVPGVEGLAFASRNTSGRLSVDPDHPGPGQLTLEVFRRRVRSAFEAPAPTPPDTSTPAPAKPPITTPGTKAPDLAR